VVLDDRPVGHVGDSPYTGSFERAVEVTASVAMHLSHRGYAVRLITEGREVSTNSAVDGDASGDPTGLVLDALAVAEPDRGSSIHRLATAVRHGSDGLLVLVLGSLTLEEADDLARARHGMGTSVAVAMDIATWGERSGRRDSSAGWSLLRSAGWAVVPLRQGELLADAWSALSFSSVSVAPEVPV
jgi:uncharacterized protein (DUF58 family)